jgi:hypothetical protein
MKSAYLLVGPMTLPCAAQLPDLRLQPYSPPATLLSMEMRTCVHPGVGLGVTAAAPETPVVPVPCMAPSHNGTGLGGGKTPSVLGES